jgi:hypothetical protein
MSLGPRLFARRYAPPEDCEHRYLGRERTAVAEMIPTHERNGYDRADLGTGVPIHSAEG